MKKLIHQLLGVSRSLDTLAQRIEQIARQAAAAGPDAGSLRRRGGRGAAKAGLARRDTLLENVYSAIRRSRKGVSIPELRAKTGLGARQLSNALYKLTKKGMVQTPSRGVYTKR